MQVVDWRRFATFLTLVVSLCFAAYWWGIRGGAESASPFPQAQPIAYTAPVEAPSDVQAVLDATAEQPRIDVVTKVSGADASDTRRLLDAENGVNVTWTDGRITTHLAKEKLSSFNAAQKCYSAQELGTTPPADDIVAAALPTGSADIEYDVTEKGKRSVIKWQVKAPTSAPAGFKPASGTVIAVTKTQTMLKATVVPAAGQKQTVTVTYPKKVTPPPAPKPACKKK